MAEREERERERFLLDESLWLRGNGGGELFEKSTGCSCCIGLFLESRGVPPELRDSHGEVADMLQENWSALDEGQREACALFTASEESDGDDGCEYCEDECDCTVMSHTDMELTTRLYDVNDRKDIDDDYRRGFIRAGFALLGVEVEFLTEAQKAAEEG